MASEGQIPKALANEFYEVRPIPNKGFGCFALKPLKRGTRILEEEPLLVASVPSYMLSDIQELFDKLTPEQKRVYFSLHSAHGQDPKMWPTRIHDKVTTRERQRILEQHAARTGKEASIISIFQTNCMEMGDGAAVFAYSSRFNHCCNPNASFTWNAAIGKETIHIINDVEEGDEITFSYCDMTHDKALRSWELKHYGFCCDCAACTGEEDGANTFAHQSATRRFRLQELERETRLFRGKGLEAGARQDDFIKQLLELAVLHQAEGDYTARLASVFLDLALVCEYRGDYRMAVATATKALEVKKISQGEDAEEYGQYAEVVQRVKDKVEQQKLV